MNQGPLYRWRIEANVPRTAYQKNSHKPSAFRVCAAHTAICARPLTGNNRASRLSRPLAARRSIVAHARMPYLYANVKEGDAYERREVLEKDA